MTNILPLLSRKDQDALAQVHAKIFWARRTPFWKDTLAWPVGRVVFSKPVKSIAVSRDKLFVAYCKSKVVILDKLQGRGRNSMQADSKLSCLQFSHCGNMLATAGDGDGTIRLWHRQPPQDNFKCFRILQAYQDRLRYLNWDPQGNTIASWGHDGVVRVSNVKTGKIINSIVWKTRLEVGRCCQSVAFSPTGELAVARDNEFVLLWNPTTGRQRKLPGLRDERTWAYAGDYVTSLAYTVDGKTLLVGCHPATIKVWRLESRIEMDENDGEIMKSDYVFSGEISLGPGWSAVALLTMTRDGQYLACTNGGSQIRIINFRTKQVCKSLVGHSGRIESLAFTYDGQALVSGACDRTVRLWGAFQWIV